MAVDIIIATCRPARRPLQMPTYGARPVSPCQRLTATSMYAGLISIAKTRRPLDPEAAALDAYEERAAIREFDGGQDRATAERAAWAVARRAAGITRLDEWRPHAVAGMD
ncbi:MAG: hypothetical protein Q8Q26_10890 [Pseudorhodobacter sp.]|nr:hypothetical protein [Pseudorhodobacter sp.]